MAEWAKLFTPQERSALAFMLGMAFLGGAVMAWPTALDRAADAVWSPVPVNRAGPEELAALPGIGPVTARRIVEDRRRQGYYFSLRDLGRVKGIAPKTLRGLDRLVRFD